jgi:hypothetical protein
MGTVKSYRIEPAYIDQKSLDECLEELNQVSMRYTLGQPPNALEKFAIDQLRDYIRRYMDDFKKEKGIEQ